MDTNIEKIESLLKEKSINYRLGRYSLNTKNASQAARQINFPEEQMLKSIITDSDGDFMLFLIPSPKKINIVKVNQLLKKNINITPKEKVEEITGQRIGTITPFYLKTNIPIYLDFSVLNFNEVSVASGVLGIEIILNPEALKTIVSAQILDLN